MSENHHNYRTTSHNLTQSTTSTLGHSSTIGHNSNTIVHSSSTILHSSSHSSTKTIGSKSMSTSSISSSSSSSSSSNSGSTLSFIIPTNQPSTTVISPPTNSPSSHADDTLGFVAPLLGAIAGLGLLAFIALYCIQQMNKPKLYSGKQNKPKWDSLDSLEEAPPPVYTAVAIPSPTKEKRSTSDIMVDSMLRSQYSPQLALSPSLVAGEFKQDTTPPPPLPSVISPSNTLINSSSCLYSLDKKSRFDTYEPQLFIEDSLQDSLKKQ